MPTAVRWPVGDTTDLVYLTDGVVIQPDSKSATDARFDSEAFTPKSDGGFLEVSFPFLWTDAHLFSSFWAAPFLILSGNEKGRQSDGSLRPTN